MPKMIQLKNIYKEFTEGATVIGALLGVDAEIKDGEFVAIMGPSGSGKTSILNIIGGLDSPTKGSVIVDGKDISKFSDKELSRYRNKSVGFVFQEFHIEQFMTVEENVLLPLAFLSGKDKRGAREIGRQEAKKLIKEVGLEDKINIKTHQLSGGQKQRVAIARALINHPKIILADEPTGNLDEKTGEMILELLKTLHKKHNVTLIIATHDEKIAKTADKIINLKNGKIC
ncbi:MAG: ABC transporter ATP-binding protein [Candidatus Gracilibacteria bacterium]|jgi:putative ABC transport system ATP-binding protein